MMPRMSASIRFASRRTSTPLMSGILISEISRGEGSAFERGHRTLPAAKHDVVALALQHDGQQLLHRPLIVDHEHAWCLTLSDWTGGHSLSVVAIMPTSRAPGRRTETVVPWPGWNRYESRRDSR